ncbi:hypothetical protein PDJAM_G00011470 [Pangasius djambal]|uniref:Uncharacterized protein n=1 Tax=Pangasius djambal TaxID=1691987 RepID=A0ACC5Y095_9TELE|nr:hypothetical protein [Pangasius djambal]
MAAQDEDSAHTRRSKTLIVRHLPADLSREEKEDLLVYFGASSVRYTMAHGPLPPMLPPPPALPPENPPLPEGTSDEEEESEYESGDDEDKERMIRLMGLVNQPCKRPLRTKMAATRKKPKLKDLLFTPKPEPHSSNNPSGVQMVLVGRTNPHQIN